MLQIGSSTGTFGSLYQRLAFLHLQPLHDFTEMPFDLYCPSLSNADLHKRCCEKCGQYFASQCAKRSHSSLHKRTAMDSATASNQSAINEISASTPESEEADVDLPRTTPVLAAGGGDEGLPIVRNLFDWLQSAFVELE